VSNCLHGSVPRVEALSPNEDRDVGVMCKQLADEAVVVMKREADEGMVTGQRETLLERAKERKDEGRNM
jgi:hypothetical protein